MGLLRKLLAPRPAPAARAGSLENPAVSLLDADNWAESFGTGTQTISKQDVSPTTALSLSAFWAAVKMISGDCSKIPLQTRKKEKGQKPTPDDSHYLSRKITPHGTPNADMSGLKLWRQVFTHALIWENAFVWLEWKGNQIANFVQLLSDRTAVVKQRGRKWVITEVGSSQDADGPRIVARPYEEVLHIEGLCIDGLAGCQTVTTAREDIGNALAARELKSRFFGEGMHAGGVLQAPIGAKPDAIKKVEGAIEAQHTSTSKSFRTLVMRDGFKFHQTQLNAQEAQQSEMDDAAIRDLARRFLLSPARLGLRDSISYNSLDADRRDYHDTTLSYWLAAQLAELNTKALTSENKKRWEIGHDQNLALVYADATTLATIATQGIQAGWLLKDEARGWFNLGPLENGEGSKPAEPAAPGGQPQGDEPAPAPDDSDPPPEPPNDDDQRTAHRNLLGAELGRLVRRLNTHAQRTATRFATNRTTEGIGRRWRSWLESDTESHRVSGATQLEPTLAACRAVGLCDDTTADEITTALVKRYRAELGPLDPFNLPDLNLATAAIAGEIAADAI